MSRRHWRGEVRRGDWRNVGRAGGEHLTVTMAWEMASRRVPSGGRWQLGCSLMFGLDYNSRVNTKRKTGLTGAQCWGPGWGCGVGGVGVDTEVVDVEVWMRRGRTGPRTLLQESEDERERRNWILSMSRSFKSCVEREGGKEGRTEVEMYGPGLGVVREPVWILPSLCSCFGRFMSFTFKWKSIWLIHCCFISSSC